MGVMYIIVFVFIACALGSIVTVWGADSALPANFSTSPLEQIEQLYNQAKKEIKDLFKVLWIYTSTLKSMRSQNVQDQKEH